MQEYKLFAQRIGLVSLTNFISHFKGIILLPILTKNLPIEDYGVWAQVMVTIGIVPSLMILGLPAAMARFLPSVKNREEFQDIFYSFLSVVTVTGMFAAFGVYLLSESIADMLFGGNKVIVEILSLIIFFETLDRIFFDYFRATQQIKKHSTLQSLKELLLMALVVIFVLLGRGLMGALEALLVKSIIVFLISTVIIVSQLGLRIPKFRNLKSYLKYGIPTVPGNMSKWILDSSDRYVIGGFLGTSAVGYYSPGYALGNILQAFIAPLNFMLPMILSKHYDEGNLDEVKKYLSYSLKYFLAVAIPGVFGLSLLSKELLEILSTPEIAEHSYLITPFVALSALLFGVFVVFQKVAMLVKKTHIMGTIWLVAAVINLGLNLLLIPYIGIIAAAVTTLLSFMVSLALMAYYSLRFLRFDMNLGFILKSVFSSFLMSVLIIFWNPVGLFSIIIMIGICVVLYFLILMLLKGFNKYELEFFRNIFEI
ncbi:oligosaccharide flippase family protein [Methanococcoides orientis]|uniref:oligosaccharide flippase family protein n=1 Tax=Methanococcoides orientis TaxID=2822137 RepID=UPI001E335530|nr:oligosaccharide flippase family protein [Methanococcoides orientis]UGV40307.1 oligosaccharide flippase family protein [Methanococcoides orientis]